MVAQFFLSQDLAGKDTALQRLNAQISRLSQLLSLEQTGKSNLEDEVSQLRASLNAAQGERDRLRDAPGAAAPAPSTGPGEVDSLNSQIDVQKEATARALAQIQNLNEQIRALRNQIAALQEALGTSDQKGKDAQVQIADLGQRLNVALAQRVQELSRYRSDFFGKLREILGNRPDIRVVGDRFVFQSELFFDSGNATLRPEGTAELDKIASALLDLQKQIPPEINWVLRVDGHTDTRQLGATSQFKSNWELSSARAISVVQYLISKGVPPQRLVAAGFGEFQPIDSGTTDEAFSHNRRIELKLTER
jgi:chemotaxis protein MotB